MGWSSDQTTPFDPERFQRYELQIDPKVVCYVLVQLGWF
jgi:hypothetical protein